MGSHANPRRMAAAVLCRNVLNLVAKASKSFLLLYISPTFEAVILCSRILNQSGVRLLVERLK